MFHIDIFTRTVIALGIIISGLGAYWFYNWMLRFRTRSLLNDLGPIRSDTFVLVYFTTPTCAPCKTIQRPAIQEVSKILGDKLQVVEVDATEKPELANRLGVMSVPTTFLLDASGTLRYVNHGVTRANKLLMQIQN